MTLHGKRDPADVIKLMIWRWGGHARSPRGATATTGSYKGKEARESVRVTQRENWLLLALKMEAATSQAIQAALETGEAGRWTLPESPGGNTAPPTTRF